MIVDSSKEQRYGYRGKEGRKEGWKDGSGS